MSSLSFDTKILGPPGTGKTTRCLYYLEKVVEEGVPPERIAFLTFTRAARLEALKRINKKESEFPYCRTIHSICYHQLGIGKEQIIRPENIRQFGMKLGIRMTGSELDPWIEEFERGADSPSKEDVLLQINHDGRHRKIMLKEALEGSSAEVGYKYAMWFTKAYHSWKEVEELVDYTDLLTKYVEYGKPLDIDVLFIDEAQDLSKLQWDVVNILGAKRKRGYFAGDDDQAIFNWAGADSSVFQEFEANVVETLDQSHRVSVAVHKLANKVVNRIEKRLVKVYRPRQSEGSVIGAGYIGSVDLSEKAYVLVRNHYRGSYIAQVLRDERIPFIGRGSLLNNVDTRIALLAWFNLFKKKEELSERIKVMLKYTNEEWLVPGLKEKLKEKKILTLNEVFLSVPNPRKWYFILEKLPSKDLILDLVNHAGFLRTALPKVELMTIHQSKGREAHTIVIDPEISRATFNGMLNKPDDEHRVWYVAITRAQERVMIMLPDGPFSYQF